MVGSMLVDKLREEDPKNGKRRAVALARERTTVTARRLFLYSIIYLPLLWTALVLDRLWF